MSLSFQDLQLKSVYRTGEDNLFSDFYRPLLSEAIRYDRAVGFFSSEVLSCNLKGLSQLVRNNGRMRLIIGEPLGKDEYEAILYETIENRQVLIEHYVDKLLAMMDGAETNTGRLQVLAYLVASKRLEIKFAIRPKGMFHEKIGIAYDQHNNCVVFQGSANETPSALFEHLNAESISVYKSWQESVFLDYGQNYLKAFNQLWEGNRNGTVILDVVSKQYERIADYINNQVQQTKSSRLDFERILQQLDDDLEEDLIELNKNMLPIIPDRVNGNKFQVRPHQLRALVNWEKNRFKGILKHATGSGKTISAIYAATKLFEAKRGQNHPLAVVISVPYIDLARQWVEELKIFNIKPLECYESRSKWQDALKRNVYLFNNGDLDFCCILVVNKTLGSELFSELINKFNTNNLLFIGDECHRHGANKTNNSLPDAWFRLGLSATPFNDEEEEVDNPFSNDSKSNILDYYKKVVDEYSLKDAILDGVLTKYDYHIIATHLTEDEQLEYDELSESIQYILQSSGGSLSKQDKERMMIYSSKRSRLLGSSYNKLIELKNVVSNIPLPERELTLFYVGEGKNIQEKRVINEVTKVLTSNNWKAAQFIGKTTKRERERILESFKLKQIDALVAMKVLDEGIDVPACKTAYILASTKNPRQYVQRRGRVLRKYPGKEKADIYDFVIMPNPNIYSRFGKKLYESEMERIRDFAYLANNKVEIEHKIDKLEVENNGF